MITYTEILSHWKTVVVLGILLVLIGLVGFYHHMTVSYKAKLDEAKVELVAKTAQLENLAEQRLAQERKLADAEQKVVAIAAEQKVKIITIKQQVIPKECNAAIDFAIQKKGDLAW